MSLVEKDNKHWSKLINYWNPPGLSITHLLIIIIRKDTANMILLPKRKLNAKQLEKVYWEAVKNWSKMKDKRN